MAGTVSFIASLPDLVVASSGTTSNSMDAKYQTSDANAVVIAAPASLDAVTYTLQVSMDNTTYYTLSDGTADIGPPAAGKARQYTELLGWPYFRIAQSGAAASSRTFKCFKQFTV